MISTDKFECYNGQLTYSEYGRGNIEKQFADIIAAFEKAGYTVHRPEGTKNTIALPKENIELIEAAKILGMFVSINSRAEFFDSMLRIDISTFVPSDKKPYTIYLKESEKSALGVEEFSDVVKALEENGIKSKIAEINEEENEAKLYITDSDSMKNLRQMIKLIREKEGKAQAQAQAR